MRALSARPRRRAAAGAAARRQHQPQLLLRRRSKHSRSPLVATLAAAALCLIGSALLLLLWTTHSYRVLVHVGNGNMPYAPNSLRAGMSMGRRSRGDDAAASVARNHERFLQHKLDRANKRRAAANAGGGGGGGGWLEYAMRRFTEEAGGAADAAGESAMMRGGHQLRELGGRFRDTHDGRGGRHFVGGRMGYDYDQAADYDEQFYVPGGSAGLHLPTPVVVVGLPKSGTTSIFSYFKCGGQLSSHFACDNHYTVNETAPESMVESILREMVQPESWRNCRLPAQDNANANIDINDADAVERERRHAARSIDSGRFPLCSVCIERNVLRGRPPFEGCGVYDIWAEIDSAEHPLPSLLAREQELAEEQLEADAAGDELSDTGSELDNNENDKYGQGRAKEEDVEEIGGVDVRPLCSYPQITHLEEIHAAYPNATFILNLRPVDNWIKSISKWSGDKRRTKGGYLRQVLTQCDLPGFPSGVGKTDEELKRFYRAHSERVREFARQHPSHALVEVDIEAEDAGKRMQQRFGVSHHCWKLRNASPEKRGALSGGQRLREAFLKGAEVLGEKRRSKSRRRGKEIMQVPTTSENELNARGESYRRRQKQSGEENKSKDGQEGEMSGGEEGRDEAVNHMTRDERQRVMRERMKKRMGVLDQFRDRRNYPVCEDLEDIFPVGIPR